VGCVEQVSIRRGFQNENKIQIRKNRENSNAR
jgi:hypothetical protein